MTNVVEGSVLITLLPGLLIVAIFVPSIAAIATLVLTKRRTRELVTTGSTFLTFGIIASIFLGVWGGTTPRFTVGQIAPGLAFSLQADLVGMVFVLAISGIYVLAIPFVNEYCVIQHPRRPARIQACLIASLGAVLGVGFAGNLLVMFLFLEILTLVSYPLVCHAESVQSRRAGFVYLGYALTSGVLVLGGMRLFYVLTSSLTFTPGGVPALVHAAANTPWQAQVSFLLLLVGFGIKAGLMPVHSWVFKAMLAPVPVFALVFLVVVLKTGSFAILRTILHLFGITVIVELNVAWAGLLLSGFTVVIASLLAVTQSELSRRLSYAAIAGTALVPLGVFTLGSLSIVGALIHLSIHAVSILVIFLALTIMQIEKNVITVESITNVGTRLPLTTAAFVVSAVSLVGIPLTAGFVGMWFLVLGASTTGHLSVVVIVLFAAVLHVVFLLPPVLLAVNPQYESIDPLTVMDSPHPVHADGGCDTNTLFGETSRRLLLPVVIGVILLILLGVFPDYLAITEVAFRAITAAVEGGIT